MCIGGDIGTEVDLSNVGNVLRSDFKLFSESNTRWIIEVIKDKQKEFEKTLKDCKTSYFLIGNIKGKTLKIKDNGQRIVDLKVSVLRDIWKNTIWNIMG
jgi:phosphoribosylformylglycinamidine synthase